MNTTSHIKPEQVSLSNPPELNEHQGQQRIAEDPSIPRFGHDVVFLREDPQ